MCLGVPGKIIEIYNGRARADIDGNQVEISVILTPEVQPGQYVLIHAGFAMQVIDETVADETMGWLLELKRWRPAHEL
jgi:hydrogenase expression/formation protein HypC